MKSKFAKNLLNENIKVFLGGTCNNSTWRESLINNLIINYFNPIVNNWTIEAQKEEELQKQTCDFLLFVITSEMKGVYSIAEVVDSSNKNSKKTIFCYLPEGFDEAQIKSLEQVKKMLLNNGAYVFDNLQQIEEFLNNYSV